MSINTIDTKIKTIEERTGEILLKNNKINEEKLAICVTQHQQLRNMGINIPIGDIIAYNKFVSRADIDNAIKQTCNILCINIPEDLKQKYQFRLYGVKDGVAQIFTVRHIDDNEKNKLIEELRKISIDVSDIICLPVDKRSILQDIRLSSYPEKEHLIRNIQKFSKDPSNGQILQQIIRGIFIDAIDSNASDIHIYKANNTPVSCHVSYRIDGILRYKYQFTVEAMASLFVRLKTEAGMDISEGRKPQDGKIIFKYKNIDIDIRVSTIPTYNGESMVLRVLNPESLRSYKELYSHYPHIINDIEENINMQVKTGGLIMITGATGSGKTTTMYGLLKDMDRYGKSILTVEDPVEYVMPGVKQVNINEHVGLTFSNILRYQVRHDPDVLVLGEMRDSETAENALRAVESGHLVIATIHAIDVRQALNRIINMLPQHYKESGAFIVANYTRAVTNQKLLRKLCNHCALQVTAGSIISPVKSYGAMCSALFKVLDIPLDANIRVVNPAGCSTCGKDGMQGRVVAVESIFFPLNRELQAKMLSTITTAIATNKTMSLDEIVSISGVKYYSLKDSVKTLLLKGIIDPMTAFNVLEIGSIIPIEVSNV